MIILENVSKYFEDGQEKRTILDRSSNRFDVGEKIALVGRSGIGKSTVLKLLLGIEKVNSGNIVINDIDISKGDKNNMLTLRREIIGCVFQDFNLIKNLSVEENILLPTFFYDNNHKSINKLLDMVDLPQKIKSQNINTLSGGEKQRVAIARALVNNPKVLIADEPTGNLDTENENKIISLFKRINSEINLTILTVTHSENVANAMDKIYTIVDGKIKLR